jgi:hypothetical protein
VPVRRRADVVTGWFGNNSTVWRSITGGAWNVWNPFSPWTVKSHRFIGRRSVTD